MGALLDLLTAPGALEGLRWHWLSEVPVEVLDAPLLSDLVVENGQMQATEIRLEDWRPAMDWVIVTATIPVPPGWSGAPGGPQLVGLAAYDGAGNLLGVCGLDPPVSPDTGAVTVTLQAMTGG